MNPSATTMIAIGLGVTTINVAPSAATRTGDGRRSRQSTRSDAFSQRARHFRFGSGVSLVAELDIRYRFPLAIARREDECFDARSM
jgi:hypothetical protein